MVRLFIHIVYKNQKQLQNVFYKKQDNFRYVFIYKEQYTLRYAIFLEYFEVGIYIQKHDTLFQVTFLYIQKAGYFAESKTIYVTFVCTKSGTLCLTWFFIIFLKLAQGGREFFILKTMHFSLHFYLQKQCILRYIFYTKSSTFLFHFYPQKKLRYVSIFKIYRIVLIPNYKHTYDQGNPIEK